MAKRLATPELTAALSTPQALSKLRPHAEEQMPRITPRLGAVGRWYLLLRVRFLGDKKLRPGVQAIPVLQRVIPLRRANMRLKVQVAPAAEHDLELLLRDHGSVIEKQEASPSQV